ncbi:Rid family detoxifying hydrolase [Chryseobacterium sediminis]|uniref:RidA family protein n=1 Tax=Chryseobacterium sediminis TaxID=1679494 RepID=UPI00286676FE|nr:Rid family detoxifying hydrolase [Chryseobacterium sediminis]MDR6466142.1 2-iminobutanoate/2-iminopropanoate deaminase [Chryseobacterium sediminis]
MLKFIPVFLLILSNLTIKAQNTMANKVPFTPSLKVDELVFISGQVGINPATSQLSDSTFEAEVKQVMENLKAQLDIYNLTFDDLISTIIYLKDMKNYNKLNEIYGSYFKNRFPTRTCIAVADLPANASVEISGIAQYKIKK